LTPQEILVPKPEHEGIGASPAGQGVVPSTSVENIASIITTDGVGATATLDAVVASIAEYGVSTTVAEESVNTVSTTDGVGAIGASDCVIAKVSEESKAGVITREIQEVITLSSSDVTTCPTTGDDWAVDGSDDVITQVAINAATGNAPVTSSDLNEVVTLAAKNVGAANRAKKENLISPLVSIDNRTNGATIGASKNGVATVATLNGGINQIEIVNGVTTIATINEPIGELTDVARSIEGDLIDACPTLNSDASGVAVDGDQIVTALSADESRTTIPSRSAREGDLTKGQHQGVLTISSDEGLGRAGLKCEGQSLVSKHCDPILALLRPMGNEAAMAVDRSENSTSSHYNWALQIAGNDES
jgi:hypothetical protein